LSISTSSIEDTRRLINILQHDYSFSLPLGPQWVLSEIQQTDKPKLPKDIIEVKPDLNMGPFLKRDENLRDKIKILHQHYEFQKVPESWFEIPRIPLPEDHCEINQILKEREVLLINIPLRDNDLLLTNIFELHKIFFLTNSQKA
jgi:hypothetical protein